LGAVGVLAFALGRHWAGVAGGAVAAVLALTRDTTLFNGALAYFDVVFLVLVMGAVLVEARRPRAGTPVLALLAVAGLWRPEAWVLSGAYALYLLWAQRGGRRSYAPLAWVAVAPAVWLTFDLVTTGDPLYSLTYTQGAARTLGRDTGVSAALFDLPRTLGQVVRPTVAIGALAGCGLGLALMRRRLAVPIATPVLFGAAIAAEVAAGARGNPRYLLVPATLSVLLCAVALVGWRELPVGVPARRWWQAGAAGVALLIAAKAPAEITRLGQMGDRLALQHRPGSPAVEAGSRAGCRSL